MMTNSRVGPRLRRSLALFVAFFSCSLAMATPQQEAKKVLGGVVSQAVSATFQSAYYLAAFSQPYDGGDTTVVLLRKVGANYARVWTRESNLGDQSSGFGSLQLVDLNKDGAPELYLNETTCGTGGCFPELSLYDTARKQRFVVPVTEMDPVIDFPAALLEPKNAAFLNFIALKAAPITGAGQPTKADPLGDWISRYGALSTGQRTSFRLEPIYAPLGACPVTPAGSLVTRKKLGNLEFVSYFKSDVVVRDVSKKRCFRVYVPRTTYDWVFPITVINAHTVALVNRQDSKDVVYFDTVQMLLWRGIKPPIR